MNVFRENLLLTDQTARECTCHKNFATLRKKKKRKPNIQRNTFSSFPYIPWKHTLEI